MLYYMIFGTNKPISSTIHCTEGHVFESVGVLDSAWVSADEADSKLKRPKRQH